MLMAYLKKRLGHCGKNVVFHYSSQARALSRIYMYDNTSIYHGFKFISFSGKLIMKANSGSAENLTVITGNHQRYVGKAMGAYKNDRSLDVEKDVIIEEEAWIGANVTICAGVTIGRGCNIGAGSVVRKSLPPYAIVIGNPAKIVGFSYTPDEIIEHEKIMYSESDRLPLDLLVKNYNKYFKEHYKEIKSYASLVCK